MSTDPLKASLTCLCADAREAAQTLRVHTLVWERIQAIGLDPERLAADVEAALEQAWPAHQHAGRAAAHVRGAWDEAHGVARDGYTWLGRLRRALTWVERDDPRLADATRRVRGVLRAHGPRLRGVTLDVRAVLGELRAQGAALSGVAPLDRVLADAPALLARLEAALADTSDTEAARKRRVRDAATARVPLEAALRRLRRAWAWANAEAGGRYGALAFHHGATEIGRRRARRKAAEAARVEEGIAVEAGPPVEDEDAPVEAAPPEGDAPGVEAPADAPAAPGDACPADGPPWT